MKTNLCFVLLSVSLLATTTPLPAADGTAWVTRCMRELGRTNDPETAAYYFSTPGKVEGAKGRAEMDYDAKGPASAAIYPTADKGFMSRYSGASIRVGYFANFAAKPPFKATMRIGQISMGARALDDKTIPGKVSIKMVIDGKSFGPYEPDAMSLSSGGYSIWLDTADTNGDSKPPLLKPAEFAKLAKAVDAMKSAEMVLVRDGKDIVRMPVPLTKYGEWRTPFPAWASSARGFVKSSWGCPNSMETEN